MPEPLTSAVAFWGACCSANFAAGIVGNLVAGVGYEHVVRNPVASALDRLRGLVGPGVPADGHDLLRALWTAQENALILCCEEILRTEKGLRPGGLAIPENWADLDAWFSTFGENDPEVKLLLRLRRDAIGRARRFQQASVDELQRETTLALEQAPDQKCSARKWLRGRGGLPVRSRFGGGLESFTQR